MSFQFCLFQHQQLLLAEALETRCQTLFLYPVQNDDYSLIYDNHVAISYGGTEGTWIFSFILSRGYEIITKKKSKTKKSCLLVVTKYNLEKKSLIRGHKI